MPSERIWNEWESYREKVMKTGCPELQYAECRVAFYAGASALLNIVLNGLDDTGDPNEVTVDDLNFMVHLSNELERFPEEEKKRRANPNAQ